MLCFGFFWKSILHNTSGANGQDSDYGWNIKADTAFVMFGGDCFAGADSSVGTKNGIFSWYLATSVIGASNQYIGANRRHDYGWNAKNYTTFAMVGGGPDGDKIGLYCILINAEETYSTWGIGANRFDYGWNTKQTTGFGACGGDPRQKEPTGVFASAPINSIGWYTELIGAVIKRK